MKFTSALGLLASVAPAMAIITYTESNSQMAYQMYTATNGSNTDLHMNISIPSSNGWGAIGVGDQMVGALMFLLLPDSTSGSTISVRTASGHVMPTPISGITFEVTNGSSANNILSASGICRGCQSWSGGTLDTKSTSQSFVWAVGPGTSGVSGSGQNAKISMHSNMGGFNADMTQAAVAPGGDSSTSATGGATGGNSNGGTGSGVTASKNLSYPNSKMIAAHAAILALVYMFFMPTAIVLLRSPGIGSWKLHAAANTISLVLVVIGMAIAINMSMDTIYGDYKTPHQGIGLAATSATIVQWFLGAAHHLGYKRFQGRWAVSYLHLALGPAIMILGGLNPILGFLMTEKRNAAIGVGVVSLLIVLSSLAFGWGMQAVKKPMADSKREVSSGDETVINREK